MLDYMHEGMAETLKVLDAVGIAHAGAGFDLAHAQQPAVVERDGVRVAFFSISDHYEYWRATPTVRAVQSHMF